MKTKHIAIVLPLILLLLYIPLSSHYKKKNKSESKAKVSPKRQPPHQIAFKVCDVQTAQKPMRETAYKSVIRSITERSDRHKRTMEDYGERDYPLVNPGGHPFVFAVQAAHGQHRPLVISPDMIWLMIAQGFSKHVANNAEELRSLLVNFKGKKMLNVKVSSHEFSKGSADNNWEGIFPQFAEKIAKNTGQEITHLIGQRFSTSTNIEQAAFEISLMDAMSPYFHYSATISCGVPEVTLEGTVADWQKVLANTRKLKKYKLDWWVKQLEPVLQEFVSAAKGKANKDFWKEIYAQKYKPAGCTTTTEITGWVTKFFPYINKKRNSFDPNKGIDLDNIPYGMSKADLLLDDHGRYYKMELMAGFIGIKQDKKTKALRPEINWAVIDTGMPPSKEAMKAYRDFQQQKSGKAIKLN